MIKCVWMQHIHSNVVSWIDLHQAVDLCSRWSLSSSVGAVWDGSFVSGVLKLNSNCSKISRSSSNRNWNPVGSDIEQWCVCNSWPQWLLVWLGTSKLMKPPRHLGYLACVISLGTAICRSAKEPLARTVLVGAWNDSLFSVKAQLKKSEGPRPGVDLGNNRKKTC